MQITDKEFYETVSTLHRPTYGSTQLVFAMPHYVLSPWLICDWLIIYSVRKYPLHNVRSLANRTDQLSGKCRHLASSLHPVCVHSVHGSFHKTITDFHRQMLQNPSMRLWIVWKQSCHWNETLPGSQQNPFQNMLEKIGGVVDMQAPSMFVVVTGNIVLTLYTCLSIM